MELINRHHVQIKCFSSGPAVVGVHKDRLYFSRGAVFTCGLKQGMYIQFINDGNLWSFFQNNDPDGFMLSFNGSKSGLLIKNIAIARLFQKSVPFDVPNDYYIQESKREYDGCPVFDIITSKPVKLMGQLQENKDRYIRGNVLDK